jgi:mRNA interferase MazF
VVLGWFPNSDLVTFKQRPALVVEADNLGTGMPQVLVAMITSNPARLGHASRVFIT